MNDAIITIIVIFVMLYFLVKNIYEPFIIFLGGLSILVTLNIIDLKEALIGFSNQGMLTVAVLFVIAGAIQKSPILFRLTNYYFGNKNTEKKILLKIMSLVSALSAFLNNTPVVAIFIPIIRQWAIEHNISPSKFLIPLSYASIFGGILTLIGTSTNLVVNGLLQEYGAKTLGMFDITLIGLPLCLVGILYISFYGYKKLPNKVDILESSKSNYREYLVSFEVLSNCKIIDKTIKKASLRSLKGLYLFEIIRNGQRICPINSNEIVKANDKLIFTGKIDTIFQLQTIEGLKLLTSSDNFLEHFKNGKAQIIEAVVSESFPYLHQTIRASNFRYNYNSAVISVIRNGERINDKIGNIVLKPGDALLLITQKDFYNNWVNSNHFYLINKNNINEALPYKKQIIAILAFLILIILSACGILPILHASLIALFFLFITRTVSPSEAWNIINWDILIVIALSFGVGNALIKSGAASMIANFIIDNMKQFGPLGILAAVYLITNVFTEIITNNVAAVLSFPIAFSICTKMNFNPQPFAIAVMIAASACFSSPIGYQTHLMVYSPGGYSFKDFVRVGLPLNIIFMIFSIILIPIFFPF